MIFLRSFKLHKGILTCVLSLFSFFSSSFPPFSFPFFKSSFKFFRFSLWTKSLPPGGGGKWPEYISLDDHIKKDGLFSLPEPQVRRCHPPPQLHLRQLRLPCRQPPPSSGHACWAPAPDLVLRRGHSTQQPLKGLITNFSKFNHTPGNFSQKHSFVKYYYNIFSYF